MELFLIIGTIIAALSLGSGEAEAAEAPPPPKSAGEELADAIARVINEQRENNNDNEEL